MSLFQERSLYKNEIQSLDFILLLVKLWYFVGIVITLVCRYSTEYPAIIVLFFIFNFMVPFIAIGRICRLDDKLYDQFIDFKFAKCGKIPAFKMFTTNSVLIFMISGHCLVSSSLTASVNWLFYIHIIFAIYCIEKTIQRVMFIRNVFSRALFTTEQDIRHVG